MGGEKSHSHLHELLHLQKYISEEARETWVKVGMGLKSVFGLGSCGS